MELFPYTLIRLGGDTYEQWSALHFPKSNSIVEEIFELRSEQQQKKELLCDELFNFISGSDDPNVQNVVQNLRRDIFNERKLKNSKVAKTLEVVPESLKASLEEYLSLVKKLKEKEQSGEDLYIAELNNGRIILKDIVDTEHLKKGLILSSRTLLNRLDSFKERPVDQFRKKEYQVEQSLLQYLTRMYAKTSPFSTFTNLSIGRIEENVEGGIHITSLNAREQVKGHMRLNNYLLKYLVDLLRNYKPAYMLFPLRCNPTLQNRGDHFLYLTNNNNIESFQRIPYNPVVEHIAGLVQEQADGIRFQQLVEALQNDIDASAEELENYVQQLIGYGLLEYHLGVSGVDPDWDIRLIEALSTLVENNVEHIDELIQKLRDIRELGDRYAGSAVEERKTILQQAYDTFREICMKIHEEAGLPADERKTEQERLEEWRAKREEEKKKQKEENKDGDEKKEEEAKEEEKEDEEVTFKHETSTMFTFKPEQMFYEDTTREVKARLDKQEMEHVIESLYELLHEMRLFQGNQDEKDKMKAYFLKKYGGNEAIDLLTFYEDYFREYKKPEKEQEERRKKQAREQRELKEKEAKAKEGESDNSKDNAEAQKQTEDEISVLPEIKQRNELVEKWKKALVDELKTITEWNEDELKIELEPVKKANSEVGVGSGVDHTNSYGSFLQFFHEEGKLKAVVNSTFPGYGKMISRFLHIFDKEVTEQTRSWNIEQSNGETIFVEDCDASYFNANLHPTLMPYEIWMPGGHNSLPADKQIPITDFEIIYDQEEGALNLHQKSTGKKAHVFDLGFQGHQGRSQLFQLLEKFTKAEYLFTQPLTNAINQLNAPEQDEKKKVNDADKQKEAQNSTPTINVLPRIVYKDLLVLQRKSWFVPKPLLPQRDPNDSDWQYFKKVNLWRKENKMPDEVFVFVNPSRWGMENLDQEKLKKLTRDDYKPQYIDFTNPLLVNLLEKLIDRVPLSMKVVEMLPSSNQMLKVDDSRYVSEFVVQWYNKNQQ
ncbi:MAEBL, putative [Fulvivirga imtechensis AK7]|uniref:MAEBL, putative n=2 Tax=Fulvivirga TaxID=396811 RepID=L8JLW1_9BACT|nr:MAEBL, putative [Fulvivirga imtechensis AK7]